MPRLYTLCLTAIAPAIWGSSYLVTTELLANLDPLLISVLRALPAGLLLLLFVRRLPHGMWIPKMFVLGALNFSIFWFLLFFAAYRLPGGIAAILGAFQPFIVIFMAKRLLGTPIAPVAVLATIAGVFGVALLLLSPQAKLDMLGVAAGLLGSASMALGTVLSRKWQPPVDTLTFTAWQLSAGGLLLVPIAVGMRVDLGVLTVPNFLGLAYLGLIGAALTYVLWLRGIARLNPTAVSILGLFSPLTATGLGWLVLAETLNWLQVLGACIVLVSVILGQYALRRDAPAAQA